MTARDPYPEIGETVLWDGRQWRVDEITPRGDLVLYDTLGVGRPQIVGVECVRRKGTA